MANIINPNGLLKYGDNDPLNPVVWRSSLTSEASISTPEIGGGTYTKFGTGQVFDPIKGLNTGSAGYYQVANFTNNALLTYGGEISFDVETAMIAATDATSSQSTGGRAQTGNEMFLSLLANPHLSADTVLYFNVSAKSLGVSIGYGTGSTLTQFSISDAIGASQFTRIGISWSGNTIWIFVNGNKVGETARPVNLSVPYYTLIFGRWGDGASGPLTTGFIRNLQIAARPLSFIVPGVLSHGMALGDSYSDTTLNNVFPAYNMSKFINLENELMKLGMRFGKFTVQSYYGRKVIGSGNAALYLKDNVVTALAFNPTTITLQTGTNDLTLTGTLDAAAFTAGMKAIIEQLFGVNGNPKTTVLRVVVNSTPWTPEYPTIADALIQKADITTIEKAQAGLPTWFNATYPSLAGRLIYQNTFEYFGGFSPDPTLYGPPNGLGHPSNKGWYKMGKSWALGVIKALK